MFEFGNALEGLMLLFTWQVALAILAGFLLGFSLAPCPASTIRT